MEIQNSWIGQGDNKPTQKNPLDKSREITDRLFTIFWLVVLCIWFSTVIYMLASQSSQLSLQTDNAVAENVRITVGAFKNIVYSFFHSVSPGILSVIFVLILVLMLGAIMLTYVKPRAMCILGTVGLYFSLIYLVLLLCSGFMGHSINNNSFRSPMSNYFFLLIKVIFTVTAIISIQKKKYEHVIDIVAKSARSFFRIPSLIIFSFIIYALIVIVISLSIWAMISSATSVTNIFLSLFLALLPACYLAISLIYFGTAVISLVIAAREFAEYQQTAVPNGLIYKSIGHVAKYQFGTIAYAATVVGPFISACLAWFHSKKSNVSTSQSTFDRIMEYVIMVYLLFHNSQYTIIMNSIDGKNYSESVHKVYQQFRKEGISMYSFVWNLYGIQAAVFIILTLLFMVVIMITVMTNSGGDKNFNVFIFTMIVCPFILSAVAPPINVVLDSVGLTIYFCKLKSEEEIIDNKEIMSNVPLRGEP